MTQGWAAPFQVNCTWIWVGTVPEGSLANWAAMIGRTETESEFASRLTGPPSPAAASVPQLQPAVRRSTTVRLSPFWLTTSPPTVPTGSVERFTGRARSSAAGIAGHPEDLPRTASVLQTAPSVPTAMPLGRLFDVGVMYSLTVPSAVIKATRLQPYSATQMFPHVSAAMPTGRLPDSAVRFP